MTAYAAVLPGRRAGANLAQQLLRFSLSIAFLFCATAAAQSAPFLLHSEIVELDGHDLRVDIYEPIAEPSDGVAIVAHGFTRSRERHRDLGQALAAAGVTAVIPDLPYILNHWGNGAAIEELAHRLEAGALGVPPTERSRLVLIGRMDRSRPCRQDGQWSSGRFAADRARSRAACGAFGVQSFR
ncbi:MAG: hypothetical protein E6H67_19060 [Betaproteobacteria bacterium]|nr:MAG: hypothetical protein E6H67_19060 [Betaproteobacteria bacterium]